jgi:LmbE family N-acetylglucosaminyl deacetylase
MLDGVRRAVFFGAHTDDEMVCAGTLRRLVRQGCAVTLYPFAPAATKDDPEGGERSLSVVYPEICESSRLIFGRETEVPTGDWMLPSKSLHARGQEIADRAFQIVEEVKPDLCLILSPEDENPAHAEVGRQCERVMRGRVPLVARCLYPWNYGLGRPNLYVTLTPEDLAVKSAVCRAYKSQEFRYNYHDLFMAAARADGLSVKAEAAERFELLRAVV